MVAALLDAGGIDPTVINGGIIESYGSNARLGASEWMVVEADESDGSFLRLDGTIAVVTNIDPEHLDHYGSFDAVKQAFVEFIENVPFYGLAVLCIDHPEVQAVIGKVRDRRVLTYGLSAQADLRGENIRSHDSGNLFDAVLRDRDGKERRIGNIRSCRCPGGTTSRTRSRRSASRSKWAAATTRSAAASPSSAASGGASPASARWQARRSSTTTRTTRSKSARFFPPRARPRGEGSSRSSSRTATPACAT